jgi:Fic family protein
MMQMRWQMDKNTTVKSDGESRDKLKALKEERRDIISKNMERLKKQNNDTGLIKKMLKDESKTIPELAKETGIKSDLVLYYISTMKKYGEIVEAGHTGRYFRYSLTDKKKTASKK